MKIEVGKTYKVEIRDCFVVGDFTSVLKYVWDKEEKEWKSEGIFELNYGMELSFENGIELSCMGAVIIKEKVEEK